MEKSYIEQDNIIEEKLKMANLEEKIVWEDGIYQLEPTDPVIGGPDGIDNKQAKQLANRTQYLKQQVEINASTTTVGRVKLNSAFNSVSEIEAATPKAVCSVFNLATAVQHQANIAKADAAKAKQTADSVYSIANTANDNANIAKSIAEKNASTTTVGRVKLNSSISSTLETEAATPLAIKTVNDRADSAHHRISEVHNYSIEINNRVNAIVDKFQTSGFESRMYSQDKRFYQVVRDDGLVGMYSLVKNRFSWYINHDGWINGYITADRIGGLDQFVRDRTTPVGVPMPWPQVHPPSGYFECNGSAFNKNQFPKLATAYPSGKLPDLRGVFIRGLDTGSGLDPNRGILSYQDDAIRNIYGTFVGTDDNDHRCPPTGAFKSIGVGGSGTGGGSKEWIIEMDASRVVPVAHENRPRNVAFMYIVKAE